MNRSQNAPMVMALRRLAAAQPCTAVHLHPLLARYAADNAGFAVVKRAHPALTAERWAQATLPEKFAAVRRVAHKPILLREGLTIQKIREREAFMAYKIDPGNNNSKFYEGIVLPSDDGSFRVMRRWGALTDSGQTGRIDGAKFDYDPRFSGLSLSQAKNVLAKVYMDRMKNGYVDVYGPHHVTPDGKKLPAGQYPVGLTRRPGFGWGAQSVAFCIPALRRVQESLKATQNQLKSEDYDGAVESQNAAERQAREVLKADSTMGQKILDNIQHMQGRATIVQSGRASDKEVRTWMVALSRLQSYIDKQLSLCNN